jgi:uncharacterized protein (DUF2336 family)
VKFVELASIRQEKSAAPERSNVGRFLSWAQTASDDQRVNAVRTLASAYLYNNLPEALQRDLELCLTRIIEDPAPQVRRALADALADARSAPRHIIMALADDRPEIAAIVLAQSPLLSDAEMVEYAMAGEDAVQIALARRPALPTSVAVSLAEFGRREAAMALIENSKAPLAPGVARRIIERFGVERDMREALLARRELPAALRCDLTAAAMAERSSLVAGFGLGPERVEKMIRAAQERSIVRTACACEPDEIRDLVRHLRLKGALTPALLMRALISGARSFFESAAAELSGLALAQAAAFSRDPRGAGFAALYRRTSLPEALLPPFRAALLVLERFGQEQFGQERFGAEETGLALRPIATQAIAGCEAFEDPELGGLLALLRRLEKEAALNEARLLAESAVAKHGASLGEERPREETDTDWPLKLMGRLELLDRLEAMEARESIPPVLAKAS